VSPAGNAEALRVTLHGKHWPNGQALLGPMAFAVGRGEVVALSGPSGCGKSTLLAIVAGLDAGYQGRVTRPEPSRLSMVFQSPRLLPWRTAVENIALGAGGGKDAKGRALAMLESLGLAAIAATYPARLSLGMARRVAVARALIGAPDILLLDEALVSLDPASSALVRAMVLAEVAARGMAVLMVSHDPADAARMADRSLILAGTPTVLA